MAAQQNKAKTESITGVNTPSTTTKPIGVQSNISVTKKQREYFKRFTSLNPTTEPLPQGDGTIRISPFDDYIIFTIFDETGENGELEDSPIDLSNVGTLTLVFVSGNDEIRIPNWTQVQNIDLSQGQVLFKINKEDSKKILALDNNNFYVSTRMEDESGVSDESVLYTGTFLGLTDAATESFTTKMNAQSLLYSQELAQLQGQIATLKVELSEMLSLDEEQFATIAGLEASNLDLTNEVAILSEELGAAKSEAKLNAARLAVRRAELLKIKRQQIKAIQKRARAASSKAKSKKFYKQAASINQEFNTAANTISTKDIIDRQRAKVLELISRERKRGIR